MTTVLLQKGEVSNYDKTLKGRGETFWKKNYVILAKKNNMFLFLHWIIKKNFNWKKICIELLIRQYKYFFFLLGLKQTVTVHDKWV